MKLTKIVPHSLCYCLVQMMLTLTIQKVIRFMRSPSLIVDLYVCTKGLLIRRISLWLRVPDYSQSFLQCIWIYFKVLINLCRLISIGVFGWFCMLPSSLTSIMCWICCIVSNVYLCLIKYQVFISVWTYVCASKQIPLINVSGFRLIPYCFYYQSFVVQLEIKNSETSSIPLLRFIYKSRFYSCLPICFIFSFHMKFRIVFYVPRRTVLEFWWVLCWNCRLFLV